jgi:DNA-binding transcriptional ArsR family regulator
MTTANTLDTSSSQKQTGRAIYLSHFTPSLMAPETLEAMLVQREPVLQRCVDSITESLRTGGSHHTLFVGPRGIGKTHLIALLHHRLAMREEVTDTALIAWMREEEWGVTSFFELVLRILRTLDASYPELGIEARTSPLYDLSLQQAEKLAESILLEVLGTKRLLVLLENLDDLFDQLGDQGQKAWRAFIQNHNNMVLVCTTPALFAGVSLQKSAFYGFFDIEPLQELAFEDVVRLLSKIAIERGDTDLATFITTPEGRARIRAVHHLAEGNPRIYIIFAQFLSKEALDELIPAFMHTLDELTPYYQARMKELPGQQRKIVEYLVNYRGAAPVKLIAKSCFITQQTCSSQLKQLKDKRYVRSIEQGRENYYELCEPLMRLCMEVKKQRGEPITLFVELLRIWYTEDELKSWLEQSGSECRFDTRYVLKALEVINKPGIEPKLQAQLKELRAAAQNNNTQAGDAILDEMASTQPSNQISRITRATYLLVNFRVSAELRGKIHFQAKQLARDFELFLTIYGSVLSKKTATTFYSVWVHMSFGLFCLDKVEGARTLPTLAALLAKFPVEAHFALISASLSVERSAFKEWLNNLFEQVAESTTAAKEHKFANTGARIVGIFSRLVTTKDSKLLLELPVEERRLLTSLMEKVGIKLN